MRLRLVGLIKNDASKKNLNSYSFVIANKHVFLFLQAHAHALLAALALVPASAVGAAPVTSSSASDTAAHNETDIIIVDDPPAGMMGFVTVIVRIVRKHVRARLCVYRAL